MTASVTSVSSLNDTERLNIGIYGCTKAGKTTFLNALLDYWTEKKCMLPKTTSVLGFMNTVDAEIERHGSPQPTAANTDDMTIVFRRGGKAADLEIVCRDLRGELLADELDGRTLIAGRAEVATQIEKCDAFLFFFDPTAKETKAAPEQHYENEFRRAEQFIEQVLEKRGNRYLPIVFVLTHHDEWRNDPQVTARARTWRIRVLSRMRELYKDHMKGFRPSVLTDPERIFMQTAAVENTHVAKQGLENVILRLASAVSECGRFKQRMRKRVVGGLAAAVAVTLLPICIVAMLGLSGTPSSGSTKPGGETPITKMLDDYAKAVPKAIPSDDTKLESLGTRERDILAHLLRWSRGESVDKRQPSPSEQARAAQMLASHCENLMALADDNAHDQAQRLTYLGMCVGRLDSGELGGCQPLEKCQSLYWSMAKAQFLDALKAILARHKTINAPMLALEDVLEVTRNHLEALTRHGVFRTAVGKTFVDELQSVEAFCETLAKTNSYPVKVTVQASQPRGGADPLVRKRLVIESPGAKSLSPAADLSLLPDDRALTVNVEAKIRWGDVRPRPENFIEVTLGGSKSRGETAYSATRRSRKNEAMAVDRYNVRLRLDEQLVAGVRIRVPGRIYGTVPYCSGTKTFDVPSLLASPQSFDLDDAGNQLVLAATVPEDDHRDHFFIDGKQSQECRLGLGTPIRCLVYRAGVPDTGQRPLIDFDAAAASGPLAGLGMPLMRNRGETSVTRSNAAPGEKANGLGIKITFSDLPVPPSLLWDAAEQAAGDHR